MKTRKLIPWFAFVITVTVSFAQDTQPTAIFKKVAAAYDTMETFSAEGTEVSDIDTGGTKMTLETSFSIKLKKPNQYLITWNQQNALMPAIDQSGAVWSDGTQPYLYMGAAKAYSKMSNDEMALSSATGISSGAAFTIPSLFLSGFKRQSGVLSRLIGAQVTGDENLEGDDCFVITGSSTTSSRETFWISKGTYMIRKYSISIEPPAGGMKEPKVTDQQLEAAIKSMGQEVTPEKKEEMRKMMQQAADSTKTAKGAMTTTYTKIGAPELSAKDFAFKVPVGVVLKKSLFGDILK